jgi:hypothetical protein
MEFAARNMKIKLPADHTSAPRSIWVPKAAPSAWRPAGDGARDGAAPCPIREHGNIAVETTLV